MKGLKGIPATLATTVETLRKQSLSKETRLQSITDTVCRFASTHLRDKENEEQAIAAIEQVIQVALDNNLSLESIKASLNQTCDTWYLGSNWTRDARIGQLTPLMATAKEGNTKIAVHLIKKYQVRVDAAYDKKWIFGTWNTLDCATVRDNNEGLIIYLSEQAIQQYIGSHATIDDHSCQYHQIWDLTKERLSLQRAKYLAQALKRDTNILKLILPAYLSLDQAAPFQEALLHSHSIVFLKISMANAPRGTSRIMSDAMSKLLETVLKSNTVLLQIDLTECDLSHRQLSDLLRVFTWSNPNTTLRSMLFGERETMARELDLLRVTGSNRIAFPNTPIDERDYITPKSFHHELYPFKKLLLDLQPDTYTESSSIDWPLAGIDVESESASSLKDTILQYLEEQEKDIAACDRIEDIALCLAQRINVLERLVEKLHVLYVDSVARWLAHEQRPWLQLQEEAQSVLQAATVRLEKIYFHPDEMRSVDVKEDAERVFRRSFKRWMGALYDAASAIASGNIASKKQSGAEHVAHFTVAALSTMPPAAALLHLASVMKHVPVMIEMMKEVLHLTHHAAHATAAVTTAHPFTSGVTDRVVHFFGGCTQYEKSKNFVNCFGGSKSAETKITSLAHIIQHHYETQLNAMLKKTDYTSSAAVLIGQYTAMHVATLFMSGIIPQDGTTDSLMEAVILWLSYEPFLETLILKNKEGGSINVGEHYAKSGIRFLDSRKNSEDELDSQTYHCNATLSDERYRISLSKNTATYGSRWATSQELQWLIADWNKIAQPVLRSPAAPVLKKHLLRFDSAVLETINKGWMPLRTQPSTYFTQGKRIEVLKGRQDVSETRLAQLEEKQEADAKKIVKLGGDVKAVETSYRELKTALGAAQTTFTLQERRIAELERRAGIQHNPQASQAAPTERMQNPPTNQAPPARSRSVSPPASVANIGMFDQNQAGFEPPIAHAAPDPQDSARSAEGGAKQMHTLA